MDTEELLNTELKKLAEHSVDPDFLTQIIALALNQGILIGRRQAHEEMNMAFKGYDAQSIMN